MSKDQMPKIQEAICNIPVTTKNTRSELPRRNNPVVIVKLKKKVSFKGHVYFELVSLLKLKEILLYLKANDSFYEDVSIDFSSVSPDLTIFNIDQDIDTEIEHNKSD